MQGYVLGISAYYHDAAAALVRGRQIVAAAQEERFSRQKHDPRFPRRAINYCLGEAFIEPAELAAVVFYDNPLLTFDRVAKNAVSLAPGSRGQFIEACRAFWGAKARLLDDVEEVLGQKPARLLVTQHHMAHAASCFYPSPFEEAAILTVDGVGEWATCTLGRGHGNRIELLKEIRYPHSLGLLYSAMTYFCGFKVNSGEYKLMGLAPYGQPQYANRIREHLIDVAADGSFRLDTRYFGYLDSPLMTNARFDELFGGPARKPHQPITRREMDLAASVQVVIEEVMLKLVAHATELAGTRNLTMAGGVALNCVANGRIRREANLEGLFIQPAAGDAGGALGAALLVAHQLMGAPRTVPGAARAVTVRDTRCGDTLQGSFLGPAFQPHEVAAILDRQGAPFHVVDDAQERAALVANALAEGKVVAVVSGRMEFGPRALGARSILADPRRPDMQVALNQKIKFRESFRPFAPAVLADKAAEYFELQDASPYMLLVTPVNVERRLTMSEAPLNGDDLLPVVRQARSDVPAVTHVDYSARVQTVAADGPQELWRILRAFDAKTGCSVLVNTSFNVRGEPIVCTPQDAYRCFMRTGIDLLVLENCLLWKSEQPAAKDPDAWGTIHELD
ncbi:MAG: carbamoyltransferase [Pirellulales bacterium]